MNIEPYWALLAALIVVPLIKMRLDDRKARKLSAAGKCPKCGAVLVDKPFTTVTLRVCPHRHGYLSGTNEWMTRKNVEKVTRKCRDRPLEELPQQDIIFAAMYRVLFSDGPNESRAPTRAAWL